MTFLCHWKGGFIAAVKSLRCQLKSVTRSWGDVDIDHVWSLIAVTIGLSARSWRGLYRAILPGKDAASRGLTIRTFRYFTIAREYISMFFAFYSEALNRDFYGGHVFVDSSKLGVRIFLELHYFDALADLDELKMVGIQDRIVG